MQYIERWINKIVPSVMKSFLQPTLIILISGFSGRGATGGNYW